MVPTPPRNYYMRSFNTIKKAISILITAVLLLTVLNYANRLLIDKTEHGIRQTYGIYDQPRNSIDVVFMGSSHIYYNVNTALLWKDYGIASYNYGAAEQPMWITYHYLKEICKYQDPKLIVLDVFTPAAFKDDYQYDYLRHNTCGMRFSLNKLQMLKACCELNRIPDYFPAFGDYHNRYKNLQPADWEYMLSSKEDRATYKGYTPYFGTSEQIEPELNMKLSGGITVKSETYLQRIIDFAADEGIDLFLIVAPYPTTDEEELVYNRIHEIADYNGIEFNSTNYFYNNMELNFETDFNDSSHLNYIGSCKFTDYLAKEIKGMYDIPDRRGEEGYESWDRHVEIIEEKVSEAMN